MNESRDLKDAESVRSGHSHVTSQPVSFPPHPVPGGMLSRSLGMPSRKNGPPSIWDTHGKSGNVLANPAASSSAPYPHRIRDASQDRQPEIQSPSDGGFSKNYGAYQQRLQISDPFFISTNSPRQQHLLVGR